MDVNIVRVWERNITGQGIITAVIDDGELVLEREIIQYLPLILKSLWPGNTIWRYMIWINIGSGYGLLPDGTKLLPEMNYI